MNHPLFIVILLAFVSCQSAPEKQVMELEPFAELSHLVDDYAARTIEQGNINALAVAIYQDGQTYHNYYGEIDDQQGNTPTDSTLFEMASISKIFVGSLAARAVTEQKISLDDDIRTYLDGDYSNLEFNGTPIRIRDLVTHTLGIDDPEQFAATYQGIFAGDYEDQPIAYGMEELLEELKTTEVVKEPGTYYDYSNLGPELVAYILEQVYEQSYEELLTGFFTELGLQNSHVGNAGDHQKYLANSYDEEDELATFVKNPFYGGAAGIVSSLPDLTQFMKYQLESNDPLVKESVRTLFEEDGDGTGYFWDLGEAPVEGFFYMKTGSSNGVQSVLLLCPDSDYGMIIIMNNQSEIALNDWIRLYNKIETDLIQYPKINAWSSVDAQFRTEPEAAIEKYRQLSQDTSRYFAESSYLNKMAYSYLYEGTTQQAVTILDVAIAEDPDNANLHDSLGEIHFVAEDYAKAKASFEQSLVLDPTNENAREYLVKIGELLE